MILVQKTVKLISPSRIHVKLFAVITLLLLKLSIDYTWLRQCHYTFIKNSPATSDGLDVEKNYPAAENPCEPARGDPNTWRGVVTRVWHEARFNR